jgi:hypothetical protein
VTVLAAHQPAYLPWLGYLDKLAKSDVFVVMDDLQYEPQNFQNRNRVKLNNGTSWLTVPVERGEQSDRILDKRITHCANPKEHWQRRTWRTLQVHYGKAPGFARFKDELEDVYVRRWERLVDIDLHMLELARNWLGLTGPILRSSSFGLEGQKTDRLIDLCRKVGAKVYLSGSGGATDYLDVDAMKRAGITVLWQTFVHPRYPQRYPGLGFIPKLAFLDLLLNCGTESRDILLRGGLAA